MEGVVSKKHIVLEESRFYAYSELGGIVSGQLMRYWRNTGKVRFEKIHGRYYYNAGSMAHLLRGMGVEVTFI